MGLTTEEIANLLKSVGDTLRIEILRVLKMSSFGVQELASIFSMPQPGMSHHLKILSRAGLIVARREANSLFYRRQVFFQASPLQGIIATLYETIDQIPLAQNIEERIKEIHSHRGALSKSFFTKNANRFKQEQGRIAQYSQYSGALEDLIHHLHPNPGHLAIEIGPGEGELLLFLCQHFERVIALDNSSEMLAKSRLLLNQNQSGVDFIEGEVEDLKENFALDVNLLVLNMVLHHFSDPAQKLKLCAELLAKEGCLLIADLCDHHQDWVKESCGDVWLGFPPTELDEWAQDSQLTLEHHLFLGLKNGFQIQIKVYRKHLV